MAGFDNEIMYAQNVDFTGANPAVGQMTAAGQLLIGAGTAPFLRANTLTAGTGISITNADGQITITNSSPGSGTITLNNGNNITITPNSIGLGGSATINLTGTTNKALQIGNASGSLTSLTAATNGQIPIGNTGNAPTIGNITNAGGMIINNGAGTISLGCQPAGLDWISVNSTTAPLFGGGGFVPYAGGSRTVFTLPATAALNTMIAVVGYTYQGWQIAQNANQIIHFGSLNTTTGVGGSLTSTNQYDCVWLLCTAVNLEWTVCMSMGNITVV